MAAEFFPIPEYDFDDEGNIRVTGCHFDVYVNGKLFCSTISENFAISIVNWFNLYAENKKQEEITARIEHFIKNEDLFLEFINQIRRAYIEKQEKERQIFNLGD